MDFALGMLTGMIIMGAVAQRLKVMIMKDMEKLKDFETWKEWKNL
jgi:uncharacterized membrane protein YciS (DUF1049 family)